MRLVSFPVVLIGQEGNDLGYKDAVFNLRQSGLNEGLSLFFVDTNQCQFVVVLNDYVHGVDSYEVATY